MREELAWAAGFFDGEGSTTLTAGKRRRDYPTPKVSMAQTGSREELDRFVVAVGAGKVRGPWLQPYNDKPRWFYQTTRAADAQAVIARLWPFLCSRKREQAADVLTRWKISALTRRPWRRKESV